MTTNKKRTLDDVRRKLMVIGTCFRHSQGGRLAQVKKLTQTDLGPRVTVEYVYPRGTRRSGAPKPAYVRECESSLEGLGHLVAEWIDQAEFERTKASYLAENGAPVASVACPDLEALSELVRELTDKVIDLTTLVQSRDGVINELRSTVARLSQRPANEDRWDPEERRQNVVRRIV